MLFLYFGHTNFLLWGKLKDRMKKRICYRMKKKDLMKSVISPSCSFLKKRGLPILSRVYRFY